MLQPVRHSYVAGTYTVESVDTLRAGGGVSHDELLNDITGIVSLPFDTTVTRRLLDTLNIAATYLFGHQRQKISIPP